MCYSIMDKPCVKEPLTPDIHHTAETYLLFDVANCDHNIKFTAILLQRKYVKIRDLNTEENRKEHSDSESSKAQQHVQDLHIRTSQEYLIVIVN